MTNAEKPTIDEMLAWLDRFDWTGWNIPKAIRAILEQHRYPACAPMEVGHELKTIRAFVERVEKRIEHEEPYQEVDYSRNAMHAELAALEKE